jgi:hypothetical protein
MKTNDIHHNEMIDLDSLIKRVKREDENNKIISRVFLWVFIFMVIAYLTHYLFFLSSKTNLLTHIKEFCNIASMIAFAWIFKDGLKDYKNIDYTVPLIDMLKQVVKRYQIRIRSYLTLLIPVLLLDVGITLNFYQDLLPISPINRILLVQAIYIPIMTCAGIAGYFIWKRKQQPLKDNALKLIEELERG